MKERSDALCMSLCMRAWMTDNIDVFLAHCSYASGCLYSPEIAFHCESAAVAHLRPSIRSDKNGRRDIMQEMLFFVIFSFPSCSSFVTLVFNRALALLHRLVLFYPKRERKDYIPNYDVASWAGHRYVDMSSPFGHVIWQIALARRLSRNPLQADNVHCAE